jgi:hypothetical protein
MSSKIFLAIAALSLIACPAFAQPHKPTDDLNGDGKVTVAEYAEARGARFMEHMDIDKDGMVTASERRALSLAGIGSGIGDRPEQARAARSTGANGAASGAVGNNESGATAAETKASIGARATAMDANGDGVLSLEEIQSGPGRQPAG